QNEDLRAPGDNRRASGTATALPSRGCLGGQDERDPRKQEEKRRGEATDDGQISISDGATIREPGPRVQHVGLYHDEDGDTTQAVDILQARRSRPVTGQDRRSPESRYPAGASATLSKICRVKGRSRGRLLLGALPLRRRNAGQRGRASSADRRYA